MCSFNIIVPRFKAQSSQLALLQDLTHPWRRLFEDEGGVLVEDPGYC